MTTDRVMEWWDTVHNQNTKRWLTGSPLEYYLDFFNAEQEFAASSTVLEIGCGLGVATKQIYEAGKHLTVLDICQGALDRVESHSHEQLLVENLDDLRSNQFDIAFSLAVAQHVSDLELYPQLRKIIGSLRISGTLLLQIADVENHNTRFTVEHELKGGILRSLEETTAHIAEVGGKVVKTISKKVNKVVTWHGLHVKRAV